MPLARTYDAAKNGIVISVMDGYRDRLARWSDIREYLPLLHEEARSRPGARILELGTRKGNSTLAFLAGIRGTGGHVWSVDVNDITGDPEGMFIWRGFPSWTFICGDDTDPEIQAKLPPQMDILFIDTSHEYEHTLTELRAYMPRLAPGGVALFHDTNIIGWPGYQWDRDIPPVRAALDDWCAQTGASWEEIPGEYGMGVIRR
jgi:predicted O-methyltransferase YrrM